MDKWVELKEWIEKEVVKKYEETSNLDGQDQLVASSFARGMDEVLMKIQQLDSEVVEIQRAATIGERIKIIANTNSHEFSIGEIVEVVEWNWFSPEEDAKSGVEAAPIGGGDHWLVRHGDYVVLKVEK